MPWSLPSIRPGPLVFLQDHSTGVRFLADSGAAVSMIPGPTSNTSISLTAANGAAITFGKEMQLTLRFKDDKGSLHQFPFSFLQGDVAGPILGSNFLRRYRLSVDLAASLLRRHDGRIFPGGQSLSLSSPVFSAIPSDIQPIISSFTNVCASGTAMPPLVVGVQHFLQTEGPPVTSRFCRLDSNKLRVAKEIFAAWERDGIVRRSSSQWSSPLHLVKKKDGSWCPCSDFRGLNLVTKADKYPVPNLADFSSHLEGCTVFSTLDLKNGYLQVPLEPSAVLKTAVITPFCLFELLSMHFGLKNAGMTF